MVSLLYSEQELSIIVRSINSIWKEDDMKSRTFKFVLRMHIRMTKLSACTHTFLHNILKLCPNIWWRQVWADHVMVTHLAAKSCCFSSPFRKSRPCLSEYHPHMPSSLSWRLWKHPTAGDCRCRATRPRRSKLKASPWAWSRDHQHRWPRGCCRGSPWRGSRGRRAPSRSILVWSTGCHDRDHRSAHSRRRLWATPRMRGGHT